MASCRSNSGAPRLVTVAELIHGLYRVVTAVRQGGQGEVLRAVDTRDNRAVAIKLQASGVAADREASILSSLPAHASLPVMLVDLPDLVPIIPLAPNALLVRQH